MPIQNIKGLEGLPSINNSSNEEYEVWKNTVPQYSNLSEQDKYKIYTNVKFRNMFGEQSDYDSLINLSWEDRIDYYNNYTNNHPNIKSSTSYNNVKDIATQLANDKYVKDLEKAKARKEFSQFGNPNLMGIPTIDYIDEEIYNTKTDIDKYTSDVFNNSEYQTEFNNSKQQVLDLYSKDLYTREKINNLFRNAIENNGYYIEKKDEKGIKIEDFPEEIASDIYSDYIADKNARSKISDEANSKVSSPEDILNQRVNTAVNDWLENYQSGWEKTGNAIVGLGIGAVASVVESVGNLYGIGVGVYNIFANPEEMQGLNAAERFVEGIINNDITEYANLAITTGSLNLNTQEYYKSIGYNANQIFVDSDDNLLSGANLLTILQSSGYTLGSIATAVIGSYGSSAVLKGFGKGAKLAIHSGTKATKFATSAERAAKIAADGEKIRKINQSINQINRINNLYITPAFVSSSEASMNAYQTREEILNTQLQNVKNEFNKRVQDRAQVLMLSGMNEVEAINQAWSEYSNDFESAKQNVIAQASKAAIGDYLTNMAELYILDLAAGRVLQSGKVRGALENTRLGKVLYPDGIGYRNANNAAGVEAYALKDSWKYSTYRFLKEPITEGIEEGFQNVSSDFWKAGANYNMLSYLDDQYKGIDTEIGKVYTGVLNASLEAAGQSITSEETLKSAFYGALGSFMGNPRGLITAHQNYTSTYVGADGKTHTKLDFSRRENESKAEYINRIMPWRTSVGQAFQERNMEYRDRELRAQESNMLFNDKEQLDRLVGSEGLFSTLDAMQKAAESNDEFAFRNSELQSIFRTALLLEDIKTANHGEYYNSIWKKMQMLSEGNISDLLKSDIISEYRNNKEADQNISDDEIIDRAQRGAKKMLEIRGKISKESESLNKLFGNLDKDTKASLVFGKIQIDNWKERAKEMDEEIKNLDIETEKSTNNSEVTQRIISKYGSIENAKSSLETLRKTREIIKNNIKELKRNPKNGVYKLKGFKGNEYNVSKEEAEMTSLQRQYEDSLNQIELQEESLLEDINDFDSFKGEKEAFLSEEEIMSLPAEERYNMLSPKNRKKYSNKQRKIIANLNKKGAARNAEFANLIKDRAMIAAGIRHFTQQYSDMLGDPSILDYYASKARTEAIRQTALNRAKVINNIKSYSDFVQEIERVFEYGTPTEKSVITKYLKDNNNEFYNKFIEQNNSKTELLKLLKTKTFDKYSKDEKLAFNRILDYLLSKDIPLDQYRTVSYVVANWEDIISFNNTQNKGIYRQEDRIYILDDEDFKGTIINLFNELLDIIKNEQQKEEENKVEVVSENKKSKTPQQIRPKVNAKDEDEDDNLNTIARGYNEKLKNVVNTALEKAKVILKNHNNKNEIQDIIDNIFNSISNEVESIDGLENILIKQSTNLKLSTNELDNEAANILDVLISGLRDDKKETKLNILDTINKGIGKIQKGNINSSEMDGTAIRVIKEKYPNNPIIKYWESHGIEQFLENNQIPTNTDVFYITDADLIQQVKEYSKANNSEYEAEEIMPIIAVIEHEKGDININGKTYQAIATLPTSDIIYEGVYNGTAQGRRIRKIAIETGNNGNSLISDGKGHILISRFKQTVADNKGYKDKNSQEYNDVQELFESDLSQDDRVSLSLSKDKQSKKQNPIWKKVVDSFSSKIVFKNGVWRMRVPKLNRDNDVIDTPIIDKKISESFSAISNTSIKELLTNPNKASELVQANSRLEKVTKVIKDAIDKLSKNKNSILVGEDKNGNLEFRGESLSLISEVENFLKDEILNHLYSKELEGFKIIPTKGKTEDGKRKFEIYMNLSRDRSIRILDFTFEDTTDTSIQTMLRHMLLDENLEFRMATTEKGKQSNFELWKWQINFEHNSTSEKNNIVRAFNDGILKTRANSTTYSVRNVRIYSPFNNQGVIVRNPTSIANKDNAEPINPINSPIINENQDITIHNDVIDLDSGEGEVSISQEEQLIINNQSIVDELMQSIKNDLQSVTESEIEHTGEENWDIQIQQDVLQDLNSRHAKLVGKNIKVVYTNTAGNKKTVTIPFIYQQLNGDLIIPAVGYYGNPEYIASVLGATALAKKTITFIENDSNNISKVTDEYSEVIKKQFARETSDNKTEEIKEQKSVKKGPIHRGRKYGSKQTIYRIFDRTKAINDIAIPKMISRGFTIINGKVEENPIYQKLMIGLIELGIDKNSSEYYSFRDLIKNLIKTCNALKINIRESEYGELNSEFGMYDRSTNTIIINRGGILLDTIPHEMIHAILDIYLGNLNENETFASIRDKLKLHPDYVQAAVIDLYTLYKDSKDWALSKNKIREDSRESNMFSNIKEFLAELGNPKTILKEYNNIKDGNFFKKVFDAIGRLLSLNKDNKKINKDGRVSYQNNRGKGDAYRQAVNAAMLLIKYTNANANSSVIKSLIEDNNNFELLQNKSPKVKVENYNSETFTSLNRLQHYSIGDVITLPNNSVVIVLGEEEYNNHTTTYKYKKLEIDDLNSFLEQKLILKKAQHFDDDSYTLYHITNLYSGYYSENTSNITDYPGKSELAWGEFKNATWETAELTLFNDNITNEILSALKSLGYSKSYWNRMLDSQREQALKCIGVRIG